MLPDTTLRRTGPPPMDDSKLVEPPRRMTVVKPSSSNEDFLRRTLPDDPTFNRSDPLKVPSTDEPIIEPLESLMSSFPLYAVSIMEYVNALNSLCYYKFHDYTSPFNSATGVLILMSSRNRCLRHSPALPDLLL